MMIGAWDRRVEAGGVFPPGRPATETSRREVEDGPRADAKILLVDDDVKLCHLMRMFFAAQGLDLETVHEGRRGLTRALGGGHDLVLLDRTMPDMDGLALLRLMRRQSEVPVIFLTGRGTQEDRIAGLDAGADDYVPKPFGPDELIARIRAVLRRSARPLATPATTLEVGGVRLVPGAREATFDGLPLDLTTIEFDLLELLMRSAGRIISRAELSAALYRRPASPSDRAVDMHVSNLRKKLGPGGDAISTVRGTGYLFRVEAEPESQ